MRQKQCALTRLECIPIRSVRISGVSPPITRRLSQTHQAEHRILSRVVGLSICGVVERSRGALKID
jgi:hypothetical protein